MRRKHRCWNKLGFISQESLLQCVQHFRVKRQCVVVGIGVVNNFVVIANVSSSCYRNCWQSSELARLFIKYNFIKMTAICRRIDVYQMVDCEKTPTLIRSWLHLIQCQSNWMWKRATRLLPPLRKKKTIKPKVISF